MVEAKGQSPVAFRLYRWNMAASAAVYEVLHLGEVVLRNAMDVQLRDWNSRPDATEPGVTHGPAWTLDPCPAMASMVGEDLNTARVRAVKAVRLSRSPSRPLCHGDVIAQLTLGTWRFLLPPRNPRKRPVKALLWEEALRHAFPHEQRTTGELVDDVDRMWTLRNRVAHLEPLIREPIVRDGVESIRSVLAAIEPTVTGWHDAQSRVEAVLARRPTACESRATR